MKTDRELLEAAAKAAGVELFYVHPLGEEYGFKILGAVEMVNWNPLTDDGDNRRLQIKLKIPLQIPDWQDIAKTWGPEDEGEGYVEFASDHNGDLAAATRLAVVRAAAAMAG
jgi:hypothetical protein